MSNFKQQIAEALEAQSCFVYCKFCGRALEYSKHVDYDLDIAISVVPCLHCLEKARKEGAVLEPFEAIVDKLTEHRRVMQGTRIHALQNREYQKADGLDRRLEEVDYVLSHLGNALIDSRKAGKVCCDEL